MSIFVQNRKIKDYITASHAKHICSSLFPTVVIKGTICYCRAAERENRVGGFLTQHKLYTACVMGVARQEDAVWQIAHHVF